MAAVVGLLRAVLVPLCLTAPWQAAAAADGGGPPGAETVASDAVRRIRAVRDAFVERRLTPRDAGTLLGVTLTADPAVSVWFGGSGAIHAVVHADRADEIASRVDLNFPEIGTAPRLDELSRFLGAYHTVHESKTASVVFRATAGDVAGCDVFARLITPTVVPDARVQALSLRRP